MARTITVQTKHVSFTDATANMQVLGDYELDIINNTLIRVNANYTLKGKTPIGSVSLTKQMDNRYSKNYTFSTDKVLSMELQQHFEALILELQTEVETASIDTTSSTTVENQEA